MSRTFSVLLDKVETQVGEDSDVGRKDRGHSDKMMSLIICVARPSLYALSVRPSDVETPVRVDGDLGKRTTGR